MKNVEASEEEKIKYLEQLYEYFDTGYDFEFFIKYYLEKVGLDEVKVTQKSRDGGIDLVALRPGVGKFSEADSINYYVQAKRYKPSSTISVKEIRELKGTIPFGNKGMFITTAKFSKDAIAEANNNPSNPVVLIDGKTLIESCIDLQIGFIYSPIFSSKMLDKVMIKEVSDKQVETIQDSVIDFIIEKLITKNDIRAKIIRVPNEIIKLFPDNIKNLKIKLGNSEVSEYKYNSDGRFISGVSQFFHENELLDDLGGMNPKKSKWGYLEGTVYVEVEEND